MNYVRKSIHSTILALFLLVMLSATVAGQEKGKEIPPQNVEELKTAITKILKETGTPAAGIALVDSTGPVWVGAIGKADLEANIDADEETMFRIGSTSKVFVALAILKLQEQGLLSLKDRVHDLIPEIEFQNPWEETDPILVEHLLEHTTGWDDIHLIESVASGDGLSLREGLELHPHSRISRWVPGTRTAYANSGPAVAAYIVEKLTGKAFETYIREEFFEPMGMETMTYFFSENYKQKGATLYEGKYPLDYWHIIFRPPGAINASPNDMAKMLSLFLNRGMSGSKQLISQASLQRMETPSTTLGAKAGLEYGYGLGLYTSIHNGFTYYKHGGGVKGGISDFSYLPEYGVGYSLQINSKNRQAFFRIARLIRDYQTKDLPKPSSEEISLSAADIVYPKGGYYQQINPRNSLPFYLPPLTAEHFWHDNDTLYSQRPAFTGKIERFVPSGDSLYQSQVLNKTNLALVQDPLYGEVLEIAGSEGGTLTLGRVSGLWLLTKITVLALWIVFMTGSFLWLPVWAFRYWRNKIPGGANIQVRIWPLFAAFFLMLSAFFMSMGTMGDPALLAQPSIASIGLMISTTGFFITALWSLITVIRYRNEGLKRLVIIPTAILSVLHTLVAFYLLWHGVIGVKTWA